MSFLLLGVGGAPVVAPAGPVWAPGAANVTYSNGNLTVTKDAGASANRTIDHTGNQYGGANIKLAAAIKPNQAAGGDVTYGFRDAAHTLGFNGAGWYLDGNFLYSGYPGFTKDGSKWHLIYLEISGAGATKKYWSWYEGYGWADHTGDPNTGGSGLDISSQFAGSTTMRVFANLYAAGDAATANFGGSAWPTPVPSGTIGFGN